MMNTNRIQIIESALGVKLPEDYARFVETRGIDFVGDMEIYGYDERVTDVNKIPCVIGATNLYRSDYVLSASEIVIAYTGIEDIIIVLDTETGNVFEYGFEGKELISDSFKSWLVEIS